MKKIILFLLIMSFAITCFAADGDINVNIAQPSIYTYKLYDILCHVESQVIEVIYRVIDSNGNTVKYLNVSFYNQEDNPSTPEDETLTEVTQLIQAINAGNNIKNTIMNAVKLKLGI